MTDQQSNKPALTPEEELDILEAVWKIGQEKGMMLLRPDQMKRLIDSGRIGVGYENLIMDKDKLALLAARDLELHLKESVARLLEEEYGEDVWNSYQTDHKDLLINSRFYVAMGKSITSVVKSFADALEIG